MTGREKATYHLKRMSAEQGSSIDDIEDARYFDNLAHKNEVGILTVKEAETALELFEGSSPVIIDTESGRWIEIDSSPPGKPRLGDTTETYLTRELNKETNDRASEAWDHMNPKERKKALGGITTEYGVNSSWEALTHKDREIVIGHLKRHSPESLREQSKHPPFETKVKPRMSEYGIFNCKECGSRCRVWKGSLSYEKQLCAVCLDKAGLGISLGR